MWAANNELYAPSDRPWLGPICLLNGARATSGNKHTCFTSTHMNPSVFYWFAQTKFVLFFVCWEGEDGRTFRENVTLSVFSSTPFFVSSKDLPFLYFQRKGDFKCRTNSWTFFFRILLSLINSPIPLYLNPSIVLFERTQREFISSKNKKPFWVSVRSCHRMRSKYFWSYVEMLNQGQIGNYLFTLISSDYSFHL